MSWYIVNTATGLYYGGRVVPGTRVPIADIDPYNRGRDAIEMTEADIAADFPDGLPAGWERVRA